MRFIALSSFFLLILIQPLWGQSSFFKGTGSVIQENEDDPVLIEHYLNHKAYEEAFIQNLEAFNLSGQEFHTYYQKALQEALKDITFPPQAGEKEKKALRIQQEIAFAQKLGPDRCVTGYNIKSKGRSPQNPKQLFIELNVRFDHSKVMQIYRNYVQAKDSAGQKTLYLTIDLNLSSHNWNDLGLSSELDLKRVLENNWTQKIQQAIPGVLKEIIYTSEEQKQQLNTYIVNTDNYIPPEYQNSLWGRITLSVYKDAEDPYIEQRDFTLSGKFLVYDLAVRRPIYFQNMKTEKRSFSYKGTDFSNQVVNVIYNHPLYELSEMSKNIKELSTNYLSAQIKVTPYSNLEQIQNLIELINKQGPSLQMKANIYRYHPQEVIINADYHGSESELRRFLFSLSGPLNGADLYFPDKTNPYHMAYKDVAYGQVSNTPTEKNQSPNP